MTTKNFCIYEIRCKDPNVKDLYIGSTTDLRQRTLAHKTAVNNPTNPTSTNKVYTTIRNNGGWSNWEVKELMMLENVSKIEARQKEEELTKQLGANLNMWKAHRSLEQAKTYYGKGSSWYEANKQRAKDRYNNMCKKISDLEKENAELRAQLDTIKGVLIKN